jgi:N-acetyl-gamma-glutamyl-phosphate reductase
MHFMGISPRPVAVVGASGYAGGELVRLLATHPEVEIVHAGGRDSAGKRLVDLHPHLRGALDDDLTIREVDPSEIASLAGFCFFSLPHGVSAELAPPVLEAGVRVIDLAGDFRLSAEAYPEWYGFEHPAAPWIAKAVYGLPELFSDEIRDASLVANPGCFPTPVILGLSPLIRAGLIEPNRILVDGKTGVSGAGKGSDATVYAATEESVRPYRVPKHQHTPEMERYLEAATGSAPGISFVPHLVPAVRGVLVTCYARLRAEPTTEELTTCLADAYRSAPFVRVLEPGAMADTKRVRGANVVELQAVADPRTGSAIVVGSLDNLVKGAAGQAIQNFNLMAGFDETTGLQTAGIYP